MSVRRTGFYLDKRQGKVLGVCAGIGDYFGVAPLWIRVGFLVTLFMIFPPVFFLYFIVGWIANAKPAGLYVENPAEAQFWAKVRVAPHRTMRDVRSSFRETDRRLRDIEAYVTSSNSRLANEIDQLR